jgi:hypothetical protein
VVTGRLQVEGLVLNVVATHLEPVEAVVAEPADVNAASPERAREARFDLVKQRRMFR